MKGWEGGGEMMRALGGREDGRIKGGVEEGKKEKKKMLVEMIKVKDMEWGGKEIEGVGVE